MGSQVTAKSLHEPYAQNEKHGQHLGLGATFSSPAAKVLIGPRSAFDSATPTMCSVKHLTSMEAELTSRAGPPRLDWDQLDCHAQFDYIKVWHEKEVRLPALTGTYHWIPPARGHNGPTLTVQDPLLQDIQLLIGLLGDPYPSGFQLAVDLSPNATVPISARENLLLDTFDAVAGRFRPEDEALWGYGTRGGVKAKGQRPKPFHRRFPLPDEELVYGNRYGWMQSTVYLKRTNEGEILDPQSHCVRMELTFTRGAPGEVGITKLSQLCGMAYQKLFNKHFRIISHPRVRAVNTRSAKELGKLERKMWRGWATAGVGKFAISPELPPDTMPHSRRRIAARGRQQLPNSDYVLHRDNLATEKIGGALRQLQRRLTPKKARAV